MTWEAIGAIVAGIGSIGRVGEVVRYAPAYHTCWCVRIDGEIDEQAIDELHRLAVAAGEREANRPH